MGNRNLKFKKKVIMMIKINHVIPINVNVTCGREAIGNPEINETNKMIPPLQNLRHLKLLL